MCTAASVQIKNAPLDFTRFLIRLVKMSLLINSTRAILITLTLTEFFLLEHVRLAGHMKCLSDPTSGILLKLKFFS